MSHSESKKDLEEAFTNVLASWLNDTHGADYKIITRQVENSPIDVELVATNNPTLKLQVKEFRPESMTYDTPVIHKDFELNGEPQYIKLKLTIAHIPNEIDYNVELVKLISKVNIDDAYKNLVLLIGIFPPDCSPNKIKIPELTPHTTNLKGCYLVKLPTESGFNEAYTLEIKSFIG
jgi:hypothetical protein